MFEKISKDPLTTKDQYFAPPLGFSVFIKSEDSMIIDIAFVLSDGKITELDRMLEATAFVALMAGAEKNVATKDAAYRVLAQAQIGRPGIAHWGESTLVFEKLQGGVVTTIGKCQ